MSSQITDVLWALVISYVVIYYITNMSWVLVISYVVIY